MSLLDSILRLYPVRKLIGWRLRRQLAAFDRSCEQPRAEQDALLQRIIHAQAGTGFGRDHGFATIRNRDDFRKQVPVSRYEYLEPYITRTTRGEWNALLSDPAVHMFAMTSGTTATRKYIPVTNDYLKDYKRGWNLWGLRVWREYASVRFRPIVQLAGDWDEFRTPANTPCGALTGLTASTQKKLVKRLYLVPPAAGRIKDAAAKYYVALRASMPRSIGMLIAANPSTLVSLARTGDQEKERLIRDIHNGTLNPQLDIPADIRAVLTERLTPNPSKARELDAIASKSDHFYPRDYWASNRFLIGSWTGGSVGAYLRSFPTYFGDAPIRDIGLLASEGRMTIPFEDHTSSGVLDIGSHYFEFMPEEEADSANPTILSADEVQAGKRYFILMTTAYGLYRYNIHDLVQVTGFHNRTPLLEFLSKGAHFSSITGEKLSEYQVTRAMTELCRTLDVTLTAYSVAPVWDEEQPYYGLFVEADDLQNDDQGRQLAEHLEQRLMTTNSEYAAKRESQRLGALRLELLPRGAWQQWDRQRLQRSGGSLEQYKHPCLINDLKFRESMPVLRELQCEPANSK